MLIKLLSVYLILLLLGNPIISNKNNIFLYHDLINQASAYIACYEYDKAQLKYQEAFQHNKEPFAIDIYNKMHVAIYSEDYQTMLECAKRLVSEKGLSLAAFEEAEGYRNFREQLEYWEKFKEWYPEGRETFLNSSNQEHIALFRQVLEDDQKFRRHPERYTTYLPQNDSIDQVNAKIIKDYISVYGYPPENRIGVLETNERGKTAFMDFLMIVFRHYFGNFEKFDFDLRPVLIKAVKEGHLHPELLKMYLMQIKDMFPEYDKLIPGKTMEASVIHEISGQVFIASYNKDLITITDSYRKIFSLSNSYLLFKKAAFSALNLDLPFELFYTNRRSILNLAIPEQKDMFIEFLQLRPLIDGEDYIHCN
ncbi:MAG: hypothetical protein EA362_00120 [Saprospirales bacterium]|nr:MAG: hypothetical protein EA362_00120 [Saprospirales bacterium]